MTIYCLGPEGSYSDKSAKIISKVLNDGDIVYCSSIYEVFEYLTNDKRENVYGVVPSENSIEGSVSLTQDLLLEFDVKILGELDMKIHHALIGYDKSKIKKVMSHPQALAQCLKYIKKNGWEVIPVSSTAKAIKKVYELKDEELGAIGPKEGGKLYNLNIIEEDIQDYPNNVTRFILIGNKNHQNIITDYKKSTIILELKEDKPGALYNILKEFNERKINLNRIESRPSKKRLGTYIFYIDYDYPNDKELENDLLEGISKYCTFIKHKGTYGVIKELD